MAGKGMRRPIGKASLRSGYSLIELLVALFVLSVIFALLIPAALATRKSYENLQCKNNLRQIGIGFYTYFQANSKFPTSIFQRIGDETSRYSYPFVELLPYIDEGPLKAEMDPNDDWRDSNIRSLEVLEKNQINLHRGPKIYLCPSDPYAKPGHLNYRLNWPLYDPTIQVTLPISGRPERILDGTSNTALCSERIVAREGVNSTAAIYFKPNGHYGLSCIERQLNPEESKRYDFYCGHTWMKNTARHVAYTHYFPPNASLLDCLYYTDRGILSARSGHNLGVNVLMYDGHVSFYSNTVDLQAWRSLGDPDDGK